MPKPLYVVADWIEQHCRIPDQEHRGEPFLLGDDQLQFVATHYTVKDRALVAGSKVDGRSVKPVDAFLFRRSQLVRAQKWGKSPLVAAFVCAEGVGPVTFAGFASAGDVYRCRDHGCGCGWVYEYAEGEPMGKPWLTPLIQITATTEDQTANTYDALRPMIELGPLSDVIPKTGEEFIRLPNGGRIDAVTSKANSRLGQRITFAAQDETGLWLETNGGHKLARTQRRGLAGMGGRSIETTNSWNPAENSVAQQTFESKSKDINKDFQQPPADLDFKKKADRRKIFAVNYAAAPWVSIDAVEAEAAELIQTDPADAERFFGNRIVSGSGSWMDMGKWDARKVPAAVVAPRTRVCLGFDGSDNEDFTGIRLETLDQYQFTPTYGDRELPTLWEPTEWGGRIPRSEVNAAVDEIATRFGIVRAYCDPWFWESEIDEWAAKYGEKKFIKWPTNKIERMHGALERLRNDVQTGSTFTHDGDPLVKVHVQNAIVRSRAMNPLTKQRQYIIGKPEEHQKIDFTMSSVLAHEAVMDAIAAGALTTDDNFIYF